jgi:hypothetical protein
MRFILGKVLGEWEATNGRGERDLVKSLDVCRKVAVVLYGCETWSLH